LRGVAGEGDEFSGGKRLNGGGSGAGIGHARRDECLAVVGCGVVVGGELGGGGCG